MFFCFCLHFLQLLLGKDSIKMYCYSGRFMMKNTLMSYSCLSTCAMLYPGHYRGESSKCILKKGNSGVMALSIVNQPLRALERLL